MLPISQVLILCFQEFRMFFNIFLIIGRPDSSGLPTRHGCPPPPPHCSRSSRGCGHSSRCPRWGASRASNPRTAAASSRSAVSCGRRSQEEAYEDEGCPSGWEPRRLRQPQPPQHQQRFHQPHHPESARGVAASHSELLRRARGRHQRRRGRGREGQGKPGGEVEERMGARNPD